jgi:hypothetical protein
MQYNFMAGFGASIEDGRKPLTMREPRFGRSRHARVGDTLQLTTFGRSAKRRVLATPVCTLRARLFLGPEGVVRVLDVVAAPSSVKAQGMAMLLANAEQGAPEAARWGEALAAADGFDSYAALYRWHVENSKKVKPTASGLVQRELIGWMA